MKNPSLLLTRPCEDSRAFMKNLRGKGWTIYVQPLLKISPVHFDKNCIPEFPHIILTSQHAVTQCAPYIAPNQTLWCVGEKTAQVCRAKGFHNIHTGAGTAEDLYHMILKMNVKGEFLHVSGKDVTVDFSNSSGISCKRLVVYETEPVTCLRPRIVQAFQKNRISHVMLFSQKTASVLHSHVQLPPEVMLLVLSEEIASEFPNNPFKIIKSEGDILSLQRSVEEA